MGTALDQEIGNRLEGKTPAAALAIFSTQDHTTPTYVRNPDLWCGDVDLTGLSPWNSAGGAQRAGTAISRLHIVYALHFSVSYGTVFRFVAADGTVHERTVVASTILVDPVGLGGGMNSDIEIGTLDSPLPASITPLLLMPASVSQKYRCPDELACRVAGTDQEEKALVFRMVRSEPAAPPNFLTMRWDDPDPTWGEAVIGGDSGNPVFAILGGRAVLWSHETGPGGGPYYPGFAAAIQALVEADGETVEFADLSGFETIY